MICDVCHKMLASHWNVLTHCQSSKHQNALTWHRNPAGSLPQPHKAAAWAMTSADAVSLARLSGSSWLRAPPLAPPFLLAFGAAGPEPPPSEAATTSSWVPPLPSAPLTLGRFPAASSGLAADGLGPPVGGQSGSYRGAVASPAEVLPPPPPAVGAAPPPSFAPPAGLVDDGPPPLERHSRPPGDAGRQVLEAVPQLPVEMLPDMFEAALSLGGARRTPLVPKRHVGATNGAVVKACDFPVASACSLDRRATADAELDRPADGRAQRSDSPADAAILRECREAGLDRATVCVVTSDDGPVVAVMHLEDCRETIDAALEWAADGRDKGDGDSSVATAFDEDCLESAKGTTNLHGSFKSGDCMVVVLAYDGREVSEAGRPEGGYLRLFEGDVVELLSDPAPGHPGNQWAEYSFGCTRGGEEGWVPLGCLRRHR